jgi:ATP-binding cassette, subfamily B, multidrug efflux pump
MMENPSAPYKRVNIHFKYIKDHWKTYTFGFVAVVFTDLCQVLATRVLGLLIDLIQGVSIPQFLTKGNLKESYFFLFIIFLLCEVGPILGRWGWRITLGRQTHKASYFLRDKIWYKVRHFKWRDLVSKYSRGPILNASNSDVNTARFIFGFTLVGVVDVVFLFIFTIFAMVEIHLTMAIWSVGILMFLPFFVKNLSQKEVTRHKQAQESLSQFDEECSHAISTIKLQRLSQNKDFWPKRLSERSSDYQKKRLAAINLSLGYIPIMGGAMIGSYAVLFTLGIYYLIEGQMSVGDFVAMQGLVFILQAPMVDLGIIISEWKKANASLDRLGDIYYNEVDQSLILTGEVTIDEVLEFCDQDNAHILEVNNLEFSFDGQENPVFKDFSLKIKKGEHIGLTGPIGAGKTTLINILSGLQRNFSQGEVSFCGKSFDQYTHQDLRRHIGVVLQRPFLFASTIFQNISMGQNLTEEEVLYYLQIAAFDEDLEEMPRGIWTPLGEWGINLSGGQKQRLALARTLARSPKILFLDDCLSAVDVKTEEKIVKNLNRELADMTILWVAHRESTLKNCQRVVELGL